MGKSVILSLTLIAGVLVAMQPAVNAEIARRVGSPYAASMLSLLLSFAILVPIVFFFGPKPNFAGLAGAPWWIFIGGLAGACVVTSGIIAVPVVGTAVFILCIVLAQMFGASIVDHFGLFGVAEKPMNWQRLGGLAIMLAGLLVVLRQS